MAFYSMATEVLPSESSQALCPDLTTNLFCSICDIIAESFATIQTHKIQTKNERASKVEKNNLFA